MMDRILPFQTLLESSASKGREEFDLPLLFFSMIKKCICSELYKYSFWSRKAL